MLIFAGERAGFLATAVKLWADAFTLQPRVVGRVN